MVGLFGPLCSLLSTLPGSSLCLLSLVVSSASTFQPLPFSLLCCICICPFAVRVDSHCGWTWVCSPPFHAEALRSRRLAQPQSERCWRLQAAGAQFPVLPGDRAVMPELGYQGCPSNTRQVLRTCLPLWARWPLLICSR